MRRLLLSLLLIIFIGFSSSYSYAAISDEDAVVELSSILKGIELNGPDDDAVKSLELFIRRNARVDAGDEALFRLAEIYMGKKDFESANRTYQELLFKFPDSEFTIEALYGLGYCQYRFGQMAAATVTLENLASNPSSSILIRVKASILLDQIYSVASTFAEIEGGGDGLAIGAIVPLEGDYAEFGERALKGILLAANVFGGSGKPVEVFVRELGEEKGAAKMVVNELSRLKRVQAIVGLLLRETAPEVAKRAQQRRVPIIALSQREGLPRTGSYVFRSFMTLSKQAGTLAKYAYDVKGYRRFAILSPRNTYGRKLAEAFKGEVLMLGGEVVGENTYVVGKSDFAAELKELFDLETFERLQGRRLIRESTPGVEIDALFIPDNYDAVAQIAPYLAFYGLQDVALLGSNGWNSPFLTELAEEHVDGAVFVDGFFARSIRKETKEFVETFKRVYGYEPGLLEAESYDASMLLLNSMDVHVDAYNEYDEDYLDRSAVRDRLFSAELYHGVTGDIYFDSTGEALKELFLLTVDEGRIREVALPVVVEGDGAEGLKTGFEGEPGDERETMRILDYILNPDAESSGVEVGLDDEPLPEDDLILEEDKKPKVKKKKTKSRKKHRKTTWGEEDDFDADIF